jgi:hypothetical protein
MSDSKSTEELRNQIVCKSCNGQGHFEGLGCSDCYASGYLLKPDDALRLFDQELERRVTAVQEDDGYHETQTLEYIKELLSDDANGQDNSFVIKVIDEKIGYLLPKGHKDYWKFHCANCGLWTGHEMEDRGERYCDCE